ncbi:MAG: ABC transporter ATP-binding protein [Bacteroidia bacterium]
MLSVANINIKISNRDILRDVSAHFGPGLHFIIGPNGSGKTSLLRSIMGFMEFDGDIFWDKKSLKSYSLKDKARLISWLPQHPSWPAHLSIEDYVLLGRFPHLGWMGNYTQHDRDIARSTLAETGFSNRSAESIGVLSGGERQQIQLARALAQDTPVMLLDEPGQALDPFNKEILYKTLQDLSQSKTIICTTHDLEALETPGALVHAMKAGKILWQKESGLNRAFLMEDVFSV